ncbi:MAG: hypothetical protein AB1468_01450 [Candidatus Micrarchaeota archaeon]
MAEKLVQAPETERRLPDALAKQGLTLENVKAGEKGQYTTKVSDQVRMTAVSYQDYFAKHYSEMKDAGMTENEMLMFVLVGMHKAGERAEAALKEKGKDWKTSKALRADDLEYVRWAEKYLGALKKVEIETIGDRFGLIGQKALENANLMPIFGEAIAIGEGASLQKGDRVLEDGSAALRGGDAGATALLYLLTFITCQGKGVEEFEKIAKTGGEETFSTSSDRGAIRRQNPKATDEEINAIAENRRKSGLFAQGLAMFTEKRFREMGGYYVVGEVGAEKVEAKLECGISIGTNPRRFAEGEAREKLVAEGHLSIKMQDIDVSIGGGQTISLAILRKMSDGIYKPVYEKAIVTDDKGDYRFELAKNELNSKAGGEYKFKAGEYAVAVAYQGKVLGQEVECKSQADLTVEGRGKEAKVGEKEPPMEVAVNVFVPKKFDWSFGRYGETDLYELKKPKTEIYQFDLGPFSFVKGNNTFAELMRRLSVRGTMVVTTTEKKVTAPDGTEIPELAGKGKKKRSFGGQFVYHLPPIQEDFVVRAGWLFSEKGNPLLGVESGFWGDKRRWGRFGIEFGNDFGLALHKMLMEEPSVSYGLWYGKDIKNVNLRLEITDPLSRYRNMALRIGYSFGGGKKKEKEEKEE